MDAILNTAIVSWIKAITGLTVVFEADQNGFDPWPTAYATFKLLSSNSVGSSDFKIVVGTEDDSLTKEIVTYNSVVMSINVYHADGATYLNKLWDSKKLWAVSKLFKTAHAAIDDYSGVRNLSALVDVAFKPQYQADFTFNYQTQITETDYIVDKLTATGTIDDDTITIVGWDNLEE